MGSIKGQAKSDAATHGVAQEIDLVEAKTVADNKDIVHTRFDAVALRVWRTIGQAVTEQIDAKDGEPSRKVRQYGIPGADAAREPV
jgi:hypothetical protein